MDVVGSGHYMVCITAHGYAVLCITLPPQKILDKGLEETFDFENRWMCSKRFVRSGGFEAESYSCRDCVDELQCILGGPVGRMVRV